MDVNAFKKDVKEWINTHPYGSIDDFTDFCESLIPPAMMTSYAWLVDQSVSWYTHILSSRDWQNRDDEENDDAA
ncbi:MAG: hypothetical protein WCI18_09165 [Pseudomonadota bacterium]